jgi:outer membrane scaffolding protein for murein synthesis (MipA/OmpV family)
MTLLRWRARAAPWLAACIAFPVWAAEPSAPPSADTPGLAPAAPALPASSPGAPEAPAAPGSAASAPAAKPKPYEWKWEGAIGPVVSVSPDYSGSSTKKYSLTPGYYLRYGRISISNTSGFVTRRNNDDIFRGLGLDFKRTDRVRFNVALRLDNGRRSAEASGLRGIENVRRTLRARASTTWQLDHGNKIALGWNTDLLGRGGGNIFDIGASHDRRLSERTTFGVGVSLSAGDHRYMQSWYGISESEAAASGHPVYTPHAGLLETGLGVSWRMQINERWIGLWGGSVSRLLGPAAHSPLTTAPTQWRASAGIAWMF